MITLLPGVSRCLKRAKAPGLLPAAEEGAEQGVHHPQLEAPWKTSKKTFLRFFLSTKLLGGS